MRDLRLFVMNLWASGDSKAAEKPALPSREIPDEGPKRMMIIFPKS